MSKETALWLNTNTLIGNTDQRGKAWHYRADLQGGEPNHYPGFVPVGDVERRLFDWQAQKVPVLAQVPATLETATGMDADGNPVSQVPVPNMYAIRRSDTGLIFPRTFTGGYELHQYREWLLESVASILGGELGISSAGLLRDGAQAWVEVSVAETLHDDVTGFGYRPNILAFTSFDGSLATTFGRTVTATVCDNTREAAAGEMRQQQVKFRHRAGSDVVDRLPEVRRALSIIHETADDFLAGLHTQAATTVTDRQWSEFLDVWAPMDDGNGERKTGRALTNVERVRADLDELYRFDERAATWQGTALGVVQAVNTFAHHRTNVRSGSRADRNMQRTITGAFDKLDTDVVSTLDRVLVASA